MDDSFVSVIFSNIVGYDMLIFILALVETFIMTILCMYDKKAAQPEYADNLDIAEKVRQLHQLFCHLASIFPALGLIGTVLSCLRYSLNPADAQNAMQTALTSTFWGLLFVMIFQGLHIVLLHRLHTVQEQNGEKKGSADF